MKQSFLLILFFIPSFALAQHSVNVGNNLKIKRMNATRIKKKIILDGHLNEKAWSRAQTISGFKQVNPKEGELAVYDSEVKIVYGEKHLYIGAFLKDTMGKRGIRTPNLKRDFKFNDNDLFGIAIDAFNDKTNAVAFQVTPYGTQRDLQIVNTVIQDVDWDAIWRSKTRITSKGWYAELAIPFNSLKYPANSDEENTQTWRINFVRLHRRSNEISAFPGYPQSQTPYRMIHAIELNNLHISPSGKNFKVNPYFLQQLENKVHNQSKWNTKVGGDFQWDIATNANLDITLNTDFAQSEVDKEVINLSRFSIYLPEKREFFLESAGLFVTGDQHVKPFFSRRIGIESTGKQVPLIGGAKFISRNSDKNLGVMYVLQEASESFNKKHYGVLRMQKNFGLSNSLGFLLSSVYEEGTKHNHVLTLDGTQLFNEKWRLSYMWSNSWDITKENKVIGSAANTNISYLSNNFVFRSNHTLISDHYIPETGFVSKNDIIDHTSFAFPIIRKTWLPQFIRSYEPGVVLNLTQDLKDLEFRTAKFGFSPVYLSLEKGGQIILNYKRYWQTLKSPFEVLDVSIDPGKYSYNRFNAQYSSDQSRKLAVSTSYEFGSFYRGTLAKAKAGVTYAPIPNIYLENNYEYYHLNGFYGATHEDVDSHLFSSSLRLALNPDVQINIFYQYNSTFKRGRLNTRFSWQFAPLSYIHLIYNTQSRNSIGNKNHRGLVKINLMKNF